MLEILKETDRRLVMALADDSPRRMRFILDKDAGLAWFERPWRFGLQRTLTVPLADIAAIDTETVGRRGLIVLTTSSRSRHRLAGEADHVRLAAERMRDFVGLDSVEAQLVMRARSPLRNWSARVATASAVTIAVAGGVWLAVELGSFATGTAGKVGGLVASAAARTQNALLLPACNAPQSRDAIQELVRDRLGGSAVLDDVSQRGQAGGERLCSAVARRDGRTANVSYRNYWDGWTPKVRLTDEIVTAKLDPARTDAIAQAAALFLAASQNSHVTGKPPRQIDPIIDQALAAVFSASDLAAEPLATHEIDKALQWLQTADRIGAVYILAGTGVEDFTTAPQTDAMQRRMRGNVTAFADEFGRYTDFQMIALAAIANAQMRSSTGAPGKAQPTQAKADDIRPLVSQAMKSSFIALVYDGHNDAWRMARLTAIGRTAPVAAKFLTRHDARAVRELALRSADYVKDATVRAKVREVANLLAAP